MQVVAHKTKEAEITEQDSLLLTRNLLRIALYNISYIRGLFPEKYFNDKSVPALEMKIKKLMPMDAESRRLIDWMEKGLHDALQKKYLKTLLFCLCEKEEGPMIEEYAFVFSYPNSKGEEVSMNMSRTGSKNNSATFKSNAAEVTLDEMRSSACKMIRTLVSLMRTLDQMPDERTILMKLQYYDDVTPEDYEPPFFKGCADNEAINIWNKNPLKMEVGRVNSKHLVLALKVKSVLDPCEANNVNSEDGNMSLGHESDQDDDFSDPETRNLLRIVVYNISYIRGLFPEKYFNDKSVPALEMKIKKLMPMDAESRRLIDWMEKGVYDALQKKYLKTLLFCICEKEEGPMIEEYAFAFSYPNSKGEEVSMNMSRTGSKKNSATFKSNAAEVTPDQMRSSACKMIRTLVSLMRTLDQMPDERTILMKLLYYDDVTPEDYEPPFFKGCADNEAINIWNKNPLKMEVGSVNSKHLVLALKVKSVLDPCEANHVNSEDDNMSLGHESDQDDDFSDTEVRPSEADRYVVAPNDGNCKGQSGSVSEEDTQDPAHEEAIAAQVREWICSRDITSVNASDVLSKFPDISMEMVEDILEKLLKDGLLSKASKGSYAVNKITDPRTPHIKKEVMVQNVSPTEGTKSNNDDAMYMKALYHALPMDYVTIAKLQGKLDGEANQNTVRKLIEKMVQDGYIKNSGNRRLGKAVIHSEASNRKLLEIKKILEVDLGEDVVTDTKPEAAEFERRDHPMTDQEMIDGSTNGCFHSVGSDLTRTRELPETEQNMSMQKDPNRTPTSMREPATSLESGVLGQRNRKSLASGDTQCTQQGKRSRKASMAKEPILQYVKRLKPQVQ